MQQFNNMIFERPFIHATKFARLLPSKNENLEIKRPKESVRIEMNECAVDMFQEHSSIFSI